MHLNKPTLLNIKVSFLRCGRGRGVLMRKVDFLLYIKKLTFFTFSPHLYLTYVFTQKLTSLSWPHLSLYSDNLRIIVESHIFHILPPTFTSPILTSKIYLSIINSFQKPTYLVSLSPKHIFRNPLNKYSKKLTFFPTPSSHVKNTSPHHHFTSKLLPYHHLTWVCVQKPTWEVQ